MTTLREILDLAMLQEREMTEEELLVKEAWEFLFERLMRGSGDNRHRISAEDRKGNKAECEFKQEVT